LKTDFEERKVVLIICQCCATATLNDFHEYYSLYETSIVYANNKGVFSGINMPHWFLMTDGIVRENNAIIFIYEIISGLLGPHAVNNPNLINERDEYQVIKYGQTIQTDIISFSDSYNYEIYNDDNYPEKIYYHESNK